MARAAMRWGVRDLAHKAGVSPTTISKYENGGDAYSMTLQKIRNTFERHGIVFIEPSCGGPGVRFEDKDTEL